jgi:hypothetical protein
VPTALRFDGMRVVIYPNDHRPAYVHVVGRGCEAVFNMHCGIGLVELRENTASQSGRYRTFVACWQNTWSIFVLDGRRFMASSNNFEKAKQRAKGLQSSIPKAISVHYDRKSGRVVVDLSSRLTLSFSPDDAQGLENAKLSQLDEIEITPSGFGIHFPKLDADLYVPALLEGLLGSRKWMASRLGQAGGQSTSAAKRSASRANGRLGGRPKKAARG